MSASELMLARLQRPESRFRMEVALRYSSPRINARKLSLSYQQIFSGCSSLIKSAPDPVQAVLNLRDFHERNILRIIDLYKNRGDAIECGQQMADLRKVIAIQTFCLATAEHEGNYCLALGGSVAKGDHTFLTDIDTVVIAAREEDREAALKVQNLMSRILRSIHIEGDDVMPWYFSGLPIESLEIKFPSVKAEGMTDSFLRSKWLSDGSFYRFLIDIQIADTKGNVKAADYAKKLNGYRGRAVYAQPEAMLELCEESFLKTLSVLDGIQELRMKKERTSEQEKKVIHDIKNEDLRPFYYALYAARAQHKITLSSPWDILSQMQAIGIISSDEALSASKALNFFLEIRHLIGFVLPEAKDSKHMDKARIKNISSHLKISERELIKMIEISGRTLREISKNIFSRLKGRKSSDVASINASIGPNDAGVL
jgi:predicted nucleotidyltransferase